MCYGRDAGNDFAESAPVHIGNSLYFFSIEKIDEEVESVTWMAYLHQVRFDKLDVPLEMDNIIKSFKIPVDDNSIVKSCGLITSID